jgi:hypothetical protein
MGGSRTGFAVMPTSDFLRRTRALMKAPTVTMSGPGAGHGVDYDVRVRTDQQTTAESVDAIIAALHAANLLGGTTANRDFHG